MRFKKDFCNSIWYKDYKEALKTLDGFVYNKSSKSASSKTSRYGIYLYKKQFQSRWQWQSRIGNSEEKPKLSPRYPMLTIYDEALVPGYLLDTNSSNKLITNYTLMFTLHVGLSHRYGKEQVDELLEWRNERQRRDRDILNSMINPVRRQNPEPPSEPNPVQSQSRSIFDRLRQL